MTEQEHIDAIYGSLPENGFASSRHVDAVEGALREYPNSTRLWCLRGDLIQLNDDVDDGRELSDAQQSYERALEINPSCVEAHEELGHFFDIMDEPERSRYHFHCVAELKQKQ